MLGSYPLAIPTTLLLFLAHAHAQASTGSSNVTCEASESWENNDQNQTPCLLWAQLASVCDSGTAVTPLPGSDYSYFAPGAASGQEPRANACNCNVVSYNLMAACSWCQAIIQTPNWVNETVWAQNCGSAYINNGISGVSTTGIDIPAWAYLIDNGAAWNPTNAYNFYIASNAASTGHSSTSTTHSTSSAGTSTSGVSTSTRTSNSLSTASTARPSSSALPANSGSSEGGGTNVGAIVGGVVGGVAALLILGGVIYFVVRRSSRATASTAVQYAPVPPPVPPSVSDPERAMSEYSTVAPTMFSNTPYGQPAFGEPYGIGGQANVGKYTGLPEVN